MHALTLTAVSLTRLEQLAKALAQNAIAGDRLYLSGHLGAGKTSLVRMMLQSLGYQGTVKSPTYNLADVYLVPSANTPMNTWVHMDLYRLQSGYELEEAGLLEYFSPPSIVCVEWPEKAGTVIPEPMLAIEWLDGVSSQGVAGMDGHYANPIDALRQLQIRAHNNRGAMWLRDVSICSFNQE